MYQPLLTNRYLTSRVIPFIAVAAVALCVALVIIVVSVMTGFLNMVKSSGQKLIGDVVISYPVTGIPHYENLIEHISGLDEVAAATPVVDTFGLLRINYPGQPATETVQVWGIEPQSFAAVTGYDEALYWKPLSDEQRQNLPEEDLLKQLDPELLETLYEDGANLSYSTRDTAGIALGMHVSPANRRTKHGSYNPGYWMPGKEVTLTVVPVDTSGGMLEPQSYIFTVVNEFVSGVFLIDKMRVMVPLNITQQQLRLDGGTVVDEDTLEDIGTAPPRATMVLVRATEGVSADELRDKLKAEYDVVRATVNATDPIVTMPDQNFGIRILTWEEQQRDFIGPVEKERELMRTLFSLVYLVCAGLVLAIFWAIVYEKTRDIGILRSIGASRLGISWIFIRYGLVVGILGAILGFGLGYVVVRNINIIHDMLGQPPMLLAIVVLALAAVSLVFTIIRSARGLLLPLVVGSLITLVLIGIGVAVILMNKYGGIEIWNPEVYYFATIPNEVDFYSAAGTMVGAVIFSLIGAFIPAAKAADTDPVKALRYE